MPSPPLSLFLLLLSCAALAAEDGDHLAFDGTIDSVTQGHDLRLTAKLGGTVDIHLVAHLALVRFPRLNECTTAIHEEIDKAIAGYITTSAHYHLELMPKDYPERDSNQWSVLVYPLGADGRVAVPAVTVNERLLADGWCTFTFRDGFPHKGDLFDRGFIQSARNARYNNRGLWILDMNYIGHQNAGPITISCGFDRPAPPLSSPDPADPDGLLALPIHP